MHDGIAVGIHVLEKARQLRKLGHRVKVIAPHHYQSEKVENYDGIPVFRFSYFWPFKLQKLAYGDGIPTNIRRSLLAKFQLPFFLLFFFLKALRHSSGVDIIHSHWTIAGLVGVFVSKLRRKKHVLSMHGAEIFVLGKNRILGFVLKNTDLLINNSGFTQYKVLEHYPGTICTVIHPGTNTDRFYPQFKKRLRSDLGLIQSDFFVLCIGKFIPRKGIEYLIEAFGILVNERNLNHMKLRIGGRGYLKSEYEKKINELNLVNNVLFLGYIPDGEIPYYYSEADLFVLPSIIDKSGDTEGLGVVLIEAGACETAVIASSVGGIPDVVVNDVNGFLVEEKNSKQLADKIELLSSQEALIKKLGENGRKRALEVFSWEKNATSISDEYHGLLH